MLVIVTYDIISNRKRREVAKLLDGYGERVQKSVFECVLNRNKLYKLRQELNRFKLDESESIIVYTIKNATYLEKWRKVGKHKQNFVIL